MQLTNDTTPAAETAINNPFLDEDFTERIIHVWDDLLRFTRAGILSEEPMTDPDAGRSWSPRARQPVSSIPSVPSIAPLYRLFVAS